MAANLGIIVYLSVLWTLRNQFMPVLLLLFLSDAGSGTVLDSEETSTVKSALFNIERVLSTEPTIFYYPEASTSANKVANKRHVAEDEWRKAPEPTTSSIIEDTPEKPPLRHVSYRDVAGIPFPSSSPRYPPQIPSYAPPSRNGFFTPPLPPEYLNPFAGKPTLRGSNSESNSHNARRPIPPPPLFRPPSFENKERVPFPPPDFMVPEVKPSGKKALNTPSRPNSHQTLDNAFKEMAANVNANNNNNKDIPLLRQANDTDFDFVPILQYPSVSRILSGSSGRKHDIPDLGDRHSGPNSRHNHHNFEHMAKNLPNLRQDLNFVPNPPQDVTPKLPDPVRPVVEVKTVEFSASAANKTEPQLPEVIRTEDTTVKKLENETKSAAGEPLEENKDISGDITGEVLDTERHPPVTQDADTDINDSESHKVNDKDAVYLWVVAWDIHVYLIASLFTLLSIYAAYNLLVMKYYKHLLSRPYYVSIHIIMALVGILRSIYLFHDAYNVTQSYPEPVSQLLLNVTCPLITTSFSVMFLYLVKTTEVSLFNSTVLKHPISLILVSLSHLTLCVCLDVTSDLSFDMTGTRYLPLVCQCVYILFCVTLGGSYLSMYKTLASAASRKQMEMFGSLYATTSELGKNRPAALCLSIRITLAVAMLILLMAVVQLYGIFGVPVHDSYLLVEPQSETMQRWIWWAYQFSVRVIEVSICYLLTWAAMQRLENEVDEKETNSQNSTTGFALFPCGPCRNTEENIDDIYPAVCNTNQAIHNYSLRTGKKVYDDSFPLNNMGTEINPSFEKFPESNDHVNSYDRRKTKRHNGNLPWHLHQQGNNYDEIGPGSDVIEIKDALTRKGLANLNRSDSDASHNSHLPAHVSYESIGYHSGTFQNRGIDNGHFVGTDREKDSSTSEHGSAFDSDSNRGSFTSGHKKRERGSYGMKKSGTLMAFPQSERKRMTPRDGIQTLREGRDRERHSPSSMLVDENGFVRFRSLADAERADEENYRRMGHGGGKKSLPRRVSQEERAERAAERAERMERTPR